MECSRLMLFMIFSPSYCQLKEDLSPVWEVYSGSSTSTQDPAHDDGKDSLENIRGFLLKKRKWPLKGFHKVICVSRAVS